MEISYYQRIGQDSLKFKYSTNAVIDDAIKDYFNNVALRILYYGQTVPSNVTDKAGKPVTQDTLHKERQALKDIIAAERDKSTGDELKHNQEKVELFNEIWDLRVKVYSYLDQIIEMKTQAFNSDGEKEKAISLVTSQMQKVEA
jgi:hypothetical protein